jgi:hypothetical protein
MRVSALILLVAVVALGSTAPAHAEKVKTNQPTKLYAGPGEQKKVLLKVKPGQNMTLLAQDGRWLKVRVQGRTGYVPRSKVDMADDGEIMRNTRRRPFVDGRSRRRGFGGEAGPDDRIGADAIGEGQEDDGSAADDEDDRPKKAAKESEDEDEPKRPKKAAKESEDEDEPKRPKKAAKTSDDEEDAPKPKKAAKESDEEVSTEDEEDVDAKSDEPEEEEADKRPTARVAKKVSVFEDADSESEEKFIARPTDVLYPVESKGDWTAVENEEGDFGWVRTEYLEMKDGSSPTGARKRQIDVGARLGLMFIQQGMRTAGSQNLKVPDNYNIGTSSVTLSLGGAITMPFKNKYILGGEVTYDYSKTLFGGIFYDPDGADMPMPGVNTAIAIHNINVRGMAGYDLKKKSGMALFGRLGYRYQSFLVDNYVDPAKNPARIPQEVVKAPTLGVAFAMPRLTQKIGLRVALDTILLGGSIKQTKGLEDGSAPTLKAVVFGTAVNYKWKKKFDLQATYDLRYMAIDFGPPLATSMRGHMGTNITRRDFFHMVTFGVARPF